mmetsp:Transcript_23903/g.40054  ORF Transcript_23903/g.40054 Transcript_23903/m.40054 type:complete len:208 (-) Transcript_23903:1406-2029(-)
MTMEGGPGHRHVHEVGRGRKQFLQRIGGIGVHITRHATTTIHSHTPVRGPAKMHGRHTLLLLLLLLKLLLLLELKLMQVMLLLLLLLLKCPWTKHLKKDIRRKHRPRTCGTARRGCSDGLLLLLLLTSEVLDVTCGGEVIIGRRSGVGRGRGWWVHIKLMVVLLLLLLLHHRGDRTHTDSAMDGILSSSSSSSKGRASSLVHLESPR